MNGAFRSSAAARPRVWAIAALLGVGLGAVVVKSASLQLGHGAQLRALAERHYTRTLKFSAPRGEIRDRDGRVLAASARMASVFAEPRHIEDARAAAKALSGLLGVDEKRLLRRLATDRAFTWVKRRVDPALAKEIRGLKMAGVGVTPEYRRFYPGHDSLGQVLGTVDIDGVGRSGMERKLDKMLAPHVQRVKAVRDGRGRTSLMDPALDTDVLEGHTAVLTIDGELQAFVEKALFEQVQKTEAKAGWAVVMTPDGAIRAMANVPLLNPNAPTQDALRNLALASSFEPGSIFKVATYAAAIDAGVLNLDDEIDCGGGRVRIGRHTIGDTHPADVVTAAEAFKVSSNIGAFRVAEKLGPDAFERALKRYGFGQSPGLGMMEEARGRLPKKWSRIRLATVSYGHGVSVTALQAARLVAAVAGDGRMPTPRLVERVEDATGAVLERGDAQFVRVMSPVTAERVRNLMAGVVEEGGTAPKAAVGGIRVAGKTGTAEKLDPMTGRYTNQMHTASFVGFAPMDEPKYVVLVVVDEPKRGKHFGGVAAAPVFKRIVEHALLGRRDVPEGLARGSSADAPARGARKKRVARALADVAIAEGAVPDFAGLLPRDAMRLGAKTGLDVQLRGAGRVVRQVPAAGKPAAGVVQLVLEPLHVSQVTAAGAARQGG